MVKISKFFLLGKGKVKVDKIEVMPSSEPIISTTTILNNIKGKKVTLKNLEEMRKLKGNIKKVFLEYCKQEDNDVLHEFNKKVMKHAIDLFANEDLAFFLRGSEDAIFRDLLYLEAKRNNFTVKIDKEGTLTINFPHSIFQLYKLLVNNFYLDKFKNEETKKKIYELYKKSLEKLNDMSEEALENHYLKQSFAQSIMHLFISKYIKEHGSDEVFNYPIFRDRLNELLKNGYPDDKDTKILVVDKILNDVNNIYISNLASPKFLELIMYSLQDNEIESIEILGNSEG